MERPRDEALSEEAEEYIADLESTIVRLSLQTENLRNYVANLQKRQNKSHLDNVFISCYSYE